MADANLACESLWQCVTDCECVQTEIRTTFDTQCRYCTILIVAEGKCSIGIECIECSWIVNTYRLAARQIENLIATIHHFELVLEYAILFITHQRSHLVNVVDLIANTPVEIHTEVE